MKQQNEAMSSSEVPEQTCILDAIVRTISHSVLLTSKYSQFVSALISPLYIPQH